MAEIDVVPKQRSNAWVWIVLAIVIAAVLIWAFTGRRAQSTTQLPLVQPAAIALAAVPVSNAA